MAAMSTAAFGISSALIAALLAAVAYGAATVLQSVGVRRFAAAPSRPWSGRLLAGRLYAAGLALDAVGFLASLVALRTLPLFLVESAIASSVGVTALLSAIVLRLRLSPREVLALAAVGAGLVLLAFSAGEGPAVRPASTGPLLLLATVPVGAMIVLGWSRPGGSRVGVALLSGAAGLAFGGVGVAARVVDLPQPWWQAAGSLLVIVLVLHGALALTAYAIALERGRVTTVAAVTFAVETLMPAVIGLVWLGDAVRPGHLWAVLAGLGFALALGGSIALASHAEPVRQTPTPAR